jgi:hypothetical protein
MTSKDEQGGLCPVCSRQYRVRQDEDRCGFDLSRKRNVIIAETTYIHSFGGDASVLQMQTCIERRTVRDAAPEWIN